MSEAQAENLTVLGGYAPDNAGIRRELLDGLQKPEKSLPSKLFYDELGSELFEQITRLDEYYLTRTEAEIFSDRIDEIIGHLGSDVTLIEFGSGNSQKTRILLDHLLDPVGYVPIDISQEKLAESATKKLPDDGVLLSLLGRARAAAGDDAGALAALSEARQRIPHDAEIVCLAGDVARNSGDLEQAKQLYKDALALDPRLLRVHLALGKVCEAEGDLDGAEQSFLAAYQALPTYGEAAIALADLYRAKEATREAVDLLVDFLAADPADMRVLFSLGLALHDDGRGEAALVVFERVLAHHKKHVPALYMAGVVLGKLKKYPEALAKWQKVIELDPGGPLAAKVRGHTQTAGDLQAIFETTTV